MASSPLPDTDDYTSDPFFSFRDPMLESDVDTSERNPLSTRIKHTRNCAYKKSTSVSDTLSRIVDANKFLRTSVNAFARRPNNPLCYCSDFKYTIVLKSSSVKCFGCGKSIRSTNHTCYVYDLFSEDEFIGRHNQPVYDSIRRKNFRSLAKCLPYTLPPGVLDRSTHVVAACQSVEFLDQL